MTNGFRSSRDIIIRTEDWDAAVRFYATSLGLEIVQRSENMVGFEAGAFRLYIERGKPHGPVFEFLVQDVQAAKERLLAAGCTLLEENAAVPRCYVRDPFGMTYNIGLLDASAT
jgi:catechol 2,3-dioxygenase-like lactoylglutathione lyase family enzyme